MSGALDDEPHTCSVGKPAGFLNITDVRCIDSVCGQWGRGAGRLRVREAGVVIVVGGERLTRMEGRVGPLLGQTCTGLVAVNRAIALADETRGVWREETA